MSISLKRKKNTPFFCILKGLSNKQKKIHFIGTLKVAVTQPSSKCKCVNKNYLIGS